MVLTAARPASFTVAFVLYEDRQSYGRVHAPQLIEANSNRHTPHSEKEDDRPLYLSGQSAVGYFSVVRAGLARMAPALLRGATYVLPHVTADSEATKLVRNFFASAARRDAKVSLQRPTGSGAVSAEPAA